jgi:hypothetical protein
MARQKFWPVALLILGPALGCQGSIVGENVGSKGGPKPTPATPDEPDPTNPDKPNPVDPTKPIPDGTVITPTTPGDPLAAGPAPLRRLTRREYNNTVRDLLGDNTHPADAFPPDREEGFLFPRAGLVSAQDLSTLRDAAESLAAAAEKNVATLAPCTGGMAEDACAAQFIGSFGLRAYRRPLAKDESDRLLAAYKNGRTALGLTYAGGIGLLVEAMLQSPSFLYHAENGATPPAMEGKVVRLGHYENASRLSYFIWGTMPDSTLFGAAAADQLGTAEQLEAQAVRMLRDERARDTIFAFVNDWLNLGQVADRPKDPKEYPDFVDPVKGEPIKAAMLAESREFVNSVILGGDGRLTSLLTANSSFVNQALAPIYKVQGVTGTELKPQMLDANQRSGLLTRAAFLTVTGSTNGSHPIKRGHKIFERVLCKELPPPPPNVPPPKAASEGGTTRERFAEHGEMKCATGCHALMDPIGFAFEHYDGIGQYRDMDNGKPVDSTGTIQLDGAEKSFVDARDISKLIASSTEARQCMVKQWVRFAYNRAETQGDIASIQAAAAAFAKNDYSIRDLLIGVITSRSFRYRTPHEGEL